MTQYWNANQWNVRFQLYTSNVRLTILPPAYISPVFSTRTTIITAFKTISKCPTILNERSLFVGINTATRKAAGCSIEASTSLNTGRLSILDDTVANAFDRPGWGCHLGRR